MKQNRKRICVIGLGHFGRSLALALAKHCDVLAIDQNMNRVNAIAENVQQALCIDGRDYQALSSVISNDFDEAIVSIGEGLEASILCTLHLKRIGIAMIRAKANTQDHADILRSVGATEVIFPELETAERWALKIINPNLLDFIPLAEDYRVMDVASLASFYGRSLIDLQLRNRFNVYVIAIKRGEKAKFVFLPGPNHIIEPMDVLVLIGREEDILHLQDYRPTPVPENPPVKSSDRSEAETVTTDKSDEAKNSSLSEPTATEHDGVSPSLAKSKDQ